MLASVIVLLALFAGAAMVHSAMPSPAYALAVVPCGDRVDSELTVLVDLPASLGESAQLEIRARLKRLIEVTHAGVRRTNIFATLHGPGDAGRPILSVCTARPALTWLLPLRRIDPHIQAAIMGAVFNYGDPSEARHVPLSQVMSDISSSQFLRAPANKLVVISAMVEQSSGLNLRACEDVDETIRTYREARAGGVQRPVFRNTAIELDVVPDSGVTRAVATCRERFWNWYFGDAEGEGTHVSRDYLPGAANQHK
jgi:hypothetical protein